MKASLSLLAAFFLFTGFTPKVVQAREAAVPTSQQQPDANAHTFTGTIVKVGGDFILSVSAGKIGYTLDNSAEASKHEGKKVEVTGTVDVVTNTLHVESIREVAKSSQDR